VNIFPNPASDFITISNLSEKSGSPLLLEITDISGKNVYSGYLVSSENSINISEIPSGLYFVKIFSENNQASPIVRKLMVR